MSSVQRFAQVFGAAYLPVGPTRLVPPLLLGGLLPLDGAGDGLHLLASPGASCGYPTARLPENGRGGGVGACGGCP